jgi:hypothetical protein
MEYLLETRRPRVAHKDDVSSVNCMHVIKTHDICAERKYACGHH